MSEIGDAITDVRRAQTWTERLYFVSPVAEALLKQVWGVTGIGRRKAAGANDSAAHGTDRRNAAAMAALGIDPGVARLATGPFAGMRYFTRSTGSLLGPKLLGSYEEEIAPWISEALAARYDAVVDVGSAEGYYAVGFAVGSPDTAVFAYDVDPKSQEFVRALAAENGVAGRVTIGGWCDHSELEGRLSGVDRALLIVDIEGYENGLLDPGRVPALRRTDIIVELHEHARPGVTSRLLNRFAYSHAIDVACARTDQSKIAAAVRSGMSQQTAQAVVPEGRRLPQLWLRMRSYPG
ncbi:MAG: hypothetical protein JWL91_748 [Sphingomonas bacterium]|nr:hypothetical protein [Sphingomonas bacterium]MDB5688872.1 hypothetical protein [Sphingomonas bacterium]